jgi:hypothetical protein
VRAHSIAETIFGVNHNPHEVTVGMQVVVDDDIEHIATVISMTTKQVFAQIQAEGYEPYTIMSRRLKPFKQSHP